MITQIVATTTRIDDATVQSAPTVSLGQATCPVRTEDRVCPDPIWRSNPAAPVIPSRSLADSWGGFLAGIGVTVAITRLEVAMAVAVPLRCDFDAAQLRALAKRSRDPDQTRRLLALAAIYDGASRTEAAQIGCVTLQCAIGCCASTL